MRSVTRAVAAIGVVLGVSTAPGSASAQRVLEVEYTPTRRAQIAVWVTSADGTYLETLALTESVARYGLGNRPGALQMNSGFRWPYGRREGVLPIWAHARASAPGAALFPRVVFQDRVSEGWASRSNPTDYSPDDHFCLAFRGDSSREGLDAVTCPSQFMSDKGRYLTLDDVAGEYREPMESAPGVPGSWTLDLFSLYPPRRDVTRCMRPGCFDHADVDRYQADARAVMPELDAVSTATPPGDTTQHLMLAVPDAWEDGTYHLFLEINVEGDYAPSWDADRFPTPRTDPSRPMREQWDMYAEQYGYPYRGQPSIVFRATVEVGSTSVVEVREPAGYGSIDGRGPRGGEITSMDGSILEDPSAPGSGVDRLRADAAGTRLRVRARAAAECLGNTPPSRIEGLAVTQYHDRHAAHRYAHLELVAPSDDHGIVLYDVRVSDVPITDDASFLAARPANGASLEIEALRVPVDAAPGSVVAVDLGGLSFERHYWIGARARDACNASSEIAVVEYTTPPVEFTTVSPCFVATAAYGTPMADEIAVLRRFRDRHLLTSPLGRRLVEAYYDEGPGLAAHVARDDARRSAARALLAPVIAFARWLDGGRAMPVGADDP
jgi:hypothetical protein